MTTGGGGGGGTATTVDGIVMVRYKWEDREGGRDGEGDRHTAKNL
jgi:hypothetical protein